MSETVATTERLVLRSLHQGDIAHLFDAFSDPDSMTWWSRDVFADEAELGAYLCPEEPGTGRTFVAAGRDDDEPYLYCAIFPRKPGYVEIGYMCRPKWRGRGIAAEAITALIDVAFADPSIRRVFADTDPDNDGSNRLLERLGFTLEGRMRETWDTHIGIRDANIWGILRREWEARKT
ncbi:GNAT family N-acetyltransferase [Croceicoccus bisphenolivorans]|uniref:GNAT family N-acetyltransferase n=1 Tax=Croceicoccus bisphenolivorans TaxID=1783232 RepID=UPI000830F52B|nr:GNAT family protein [Croceicoccus bisphenolivorans]